MAMLVHRSVAGRRSHLCVATALKDPTPFNNPKNQQGIGPIRRAEFEPVFRRALIQQMA